MGQYGNVAVNVKVFEIKSKPSATAKGGVFQNIGNCVATISVGELVLFEHFSGRISRHFRTVEEFENGENANLIIDYSNSIKLDTGAYLDKSKPSFDFQAILEVETMKTFSKGFSKSERDENNAKAVGMDMVEYTKLAEEAMKAANNISGELEKKEESKGDGKTALEQLEQEIG